MKTTQRKLNKKEMVSIGAKVDEGLHKEIKYAALRQNVSMSTIVEKALRQFVDTELKGSD